jgi:hypothetical protein
VLCETQSVVIKANPIKRIVLVATQQGKLVVDAQGTVSKTLTLRRVS